MVNNNLKIYQKTIKEEMESFEQTRINDFKKGIDQYLKKVY